MKRRGRQARTEGEFLGAGGVPAIVVSSMRGTGSNR